MRASPLVRALAVVVCSVGPAGCGELEELEELSSETLEDRTVITTSRPRSSLEDRCWAVTLPDPNPDPDQLDDPTCKDPGPDSKWVLHGRNGMFSDGYFDVPDFFVPATEVPWRLRGFCLYQYLGDGRPSAAEVESLSGSKRASLDCPVVTPFATDLAKRLRGPLSEAFLAHAGGENIQPGDFPARVAVVDTRSQRVPGSWRADGHAEAVGGVVEALACGGQDGCGVEVDYSLGLPIETETSTLGRGEYGTRTHVALGIMEAVGAWRQDYWGWSSPPRLVINLSVGWVTAPPLDEMAADQDGEAEPWSADHVADFLAFVDWGSTEPLDSRVAVEALHGALMYAACHGALIVAAAGNGGDDSCNERPVAPAVWARYPAPTAAECNALGFPAPVDPADGARPPLVVPVAALRHDDRPIAATRPDSQTALMASGYHVTTEAGEVPLTGTSMSAAAVSAAFAVTWTYFPQWPPETVTTMVRELSPVVSGLAPELLEHSPTGPLGSVHRLSICSLFGVCDPGRLRSAGDKLRETIYDVPAGSPPDEWLEQETMRFDTCSACSNSADVVVPSTELPGSHWFFNDCRALDSTFEFDRTHYELSGPQPNRHICPDCPLTWSADTGWVVDLQVADAFRTGWHGANLVVMEASGTQTVIDLQSYRLRLQGGERVRINLGRVVRDPRSVTMNLVMDARTSTASPAETMTRGNELLLVR